MAVVITATSVVTGGFFIVKNYINSQISVKEKEMGKEFRQEVERIVDSRFAKQDAKFDSIDSKFDSIDSKFAQQSADIDKKISQQTDEIRNLITENLPQKSG